MDTALAWLLTLICLVAATDVLILTFKGERP